MKRKNNKIKKFTLKDYLFHGVFFFFYGFVKYLPSPIGDLLRFVVVKFACREIGKVRIYEGVTFWYPYRIRIGNNVTLNEWVYLSGYGGIEIEDNVRIGHRTSIVTSDHKHADIRIPIFRQDIIFGKVKICRDALIGCNVTILQGVTIGRGAIVGAGAVVTGDVKPYEIVAGVPARPIKNRRLK